MWLRVCVAFGIGLGLILIGQRLRESDPQFGRVLSGGGIGVWFITGFAAYQLFELVPAIAAFAFMAAVTTLAFTLSVRQNAVPLALIGVLGGLGTPFLLRTAERGPAGAVVFLSFVVGGAMAIYVSRGWRPLLWTTVPGGWAAMVACLFQYRPDDPGNASPETASVARAVLQAGATYLWLVFAVVPMWRETVAVRSPAKWPRDGAIKDTSDLQLLATIAPVVALLMTVAVWELEKEMSGWIAGGGALAYTGVVLRARRADIFDGFLSSHIQAAIVLWTLFISLAFEGDTLMIGLASEAAVLHIIGSRSSRRSMSIWGHGIFLMIGFMTLTRIMGNVDGTPFLNRLALADLWVLIAGVTATFWMDRPGHRFAYRYPAHVLLLFLVVREFRHVTNGQGFVSAIWGTYAAGLIVAGLKQRIPKLRTVGLITLFVVIAKLIFIDLSEVKAIWRVLLFLGFGGGLLWLSYFFHNMSDREHGAGTDPER